MRVAKRTRLAGGVIAVLAAISLLATACGGAASPTATSAPKAEAKPTTAAPAASPAASPAAKAPAAASPAASPAAKAPAKDLGKVRIGLSVAKTFEFLPAPAGLELGMYKKHGVDLEIVSFPGDAAMQQAFAAGAIDMGLGSATGAGGAIPKGVPEIAVGQISDTPRFMVFIGSTQQGITSIDQLKGKAIGVTTHASFTDWAAGKLNQAKGWTGSDAVVPTPLGGFAEQVAALKRGQTAGFVWTVDGGFQMESEGVGKVLMSVGDIAPNLTFEILLANTDFIKNKPDAVQAVVNGFYETTDYMVKNKDKTIDLMVKYLELPKDVAGKVYDFDMKSFSKDGTWNDEAMKNAMQGLVDTGTLDKAPELDKVRTKQFVPAKY